MVNVYNCATILQSVLIMYMQSRTKQNQYLCPSLYLCTVRMCGWGGGGCVNCCDVAMCVPLLL